MKIRTLRCWLFGHIFVIKYQEREGEMIWNKIMKTGFCVRCGIDRK